MIRPALSIYHKALLYFDGADASTTFTDQSGKTWTARGNAQLDTAQRKHGSASGLFDGTGDSADTPDHADFTISADMAIIFYVRFNSVAVNNAFAGQRTDGNNEWLFWWLVSGTNLSFRIISGGADVVTLNATWSPSANVWYRIAIHRIGNVWTSYVDSVQKATVTDASGFANYTGVLQIAAADAASVVLNGWMDNFEFINGIGYSAAQEKRFFAWLTGRLM